MFGGSKINITFVPQLSHEGLMKYIKQFKMKFIKDLTDAINGTLSVSVNFFNTYNIPFVINNSGINFEIGKHKFNTDEDNDLPSVLSELLHGINNSNKYVLEVDCLIKTTEVIEHLLKLDLDHRYFTHNTAYGEFTIFTDGKNLTIDDKTPFMYSEIILNSLLEIE